MSNNNDNNDDDISLDEEHVSREMEYMRRLFPNAMFDIDIPYQDLNDLVTDEKRIIIEHTYRCRCYSNRELLGKTVHFYISGEKLTNHNVLDELIKQNLVLDCDHSFLEGFNKISDGCYELIVGS